jgi:hypothetical protein
MSAPDHLVDRPAAKGMFASNSLLEHLARGFAGIAALAAAIAVAQWSTEWWAVSVSLGLGAITLTLFRGCPVCWTVGLIETGYRTLAGRSGHPDL